MRRLLKVGIVVLVVIVVLTVAVVAVFALDLSSYAATGSQTLSPVGTSVGKALVIYDPGVSGAPKQDATKIADDLQAKGYTIVLAGVRSGMAITQLAITSSLWVDPCILENSQAQLMDT